MSFLLLGIFGRLSMVFGIVFRLLIWVIINDGCNCLVVLRVIVFFMLFVELLDVLMMCVLL